jgi:hypothetical protein
MRDLFQQSTWPFTILLRVANRWQCSDNALVVGNLSIGKGHIEIHADQDSLATHVNRGQA